MRNQYSALERSFEGCPFGGAVVFWDVDTYLVAWLGLKVGYAREQYAVFFFADFYEVMAILKLELSDDLLAWNRADLLVEECPIVCDGELKDITLNELRFAGIVSRYWVHFAIRADHILTIEDTLDNLAEVVVLNNRRDFFVVTNQTDKKLICSCEISLSFLDECSEPFDLFLWYVCHYFSLVSQ